ncbi:MAG: flagellar hook-length control protein FliK [Acidimicrobiia bacterium]
MIPSVAFSDVVTSITSTGTSSSKGSAPESGAFGDLLASLAATSADTSPPDSSSPDLSAAGADETSDTTAVPEPDSSVLLQLLSVLGLMPQTKLPLVEAMPAVVEAPTGDTVPPLVSAAGVPLPAEPAAKSVIMPPVVDDTSTVIDVTDPAAPAMPSADAPVVDAPVVDAPRTAHDCATPTGAADSSAPPAPATATASIATPASNASPHGARARFEGLRNARRAAAVDTTATDATPDAAADADPTPTRTAARRRDPFATMNAAHPHLHAVAAPITPLSAEAAAESDGATSTTVDAAANGAATSHASALVMKSASSITTEAANAVSTEQAPPPQPWEQVVSAMKPLRKFSDGSHRLAVQLHPDDLGTVHVELSLHKGELNVHMVAQNDAARDALLGSLHELRSDLEASGVRAAAIHVGHDTVRPDGTGVAGNTPTTQYAPSSNGSSLTPNQQQNLADGSWQQSNRRRAFSTGNRDQTDATVVDVAAVAQAANTTSNLDLRI